jgi:hypothetical protein
MITDILPKSQAFHQNAKHQTSEAEGSASQTRLRDWLDEFRESAIPDSLTLANVKYCDPGDETILELLTEHTIANAQKSTHYTGTQARRTLDLYENARMGGWYAHGTTIGGDSGEVAHVKLDNPRETASFKGFGKIPELKKVKYEGPSKCPALPLLPCVDPETAQLIYARHHIDPEMGETFWQAVQRSGCPIIITEGLKKALCLMAHGIPAICVRGVACWHPKDEKHLYQQIADFATVGRKIYICYDQDLKPATVKNVGIQIRQLGKALERCGVDVRVMSWHPEAGKGIDDAVYAMGEGGQVWIDDILKSAVTIKEWVKSGRVQQLLESIRRAKALPFEPDRDTEGGYLPEVPNAEIGTITILEAPTAAGKTQEIARQVQDWKARGGNVMLPYSLNSLGQQAANRCENERKEALPHSHDFYGEEEFHNAIQAFQGVVLCYDSLHRVPEWFYKKPLLLILDECNQGLDHIVQGGTLKDRQEEIIKLFSKALKVAGQKGAIILAEAKVYPHSVALVKRLSGCDTVKYYRHDRIVDRGIVELEKTMNSGSLVTQAIESLKRGERIMWCTSSQKNARRMEYILQKFGFSTLRIDSETNRGTRDGDPSPFAPFFTDPDDYLADLGCPDALIVSPTCKTGLSIEKDWFDRVFGYFPNCDSDTALQMMTRYRSPVPRHIATPSFITTSGYESLPTAKSVKSRIAYNQKVSSACLSIEAIENADDEFAATAAAIIDFYAASASLRGAQKQIAHLCLIDTLESERFEVIETTSTRSPEGEAEMREARESIWREDAGILAQSETSDDWRDDENKPQTLKAEWATIKGKLTEKYPGINWDCPETCYYSYNRLDELMPRGVDLQVRCEDLDAANLEDLKDAKSTARSGLLHKTPTSHLNALLLNNIGVLRLLEEGLIFDDENPILIDVANRARSFRKDLKFFKGLTIGDQSIDTKGRRTHSPIDVCGKLLKLLGLEWNVVSRLSANGKRDRQYQVAPIVPKVHDDLNNDYHNSEIEAQDRLKALQYRQELLEAARVALAAIKAKHQTYQAATSTEEPASEQTQTDYSPPPNCDVSDDDVYEFTADHEPDDDEVATC